MTPEPGVLNLQAAPGSDLDRVRALREVAPTARDASRSWVDWDNLQDYLGQPFDNRKIPLSKLEQMRLDPMLAFGLAYAKLPMVRCLWRIKSERADIAEGVDRAIRAIFGRTVLGILNDLDYGYSPGVKRYQLEKPDWTYQDQKGNVLPVWPHDNSMVTFRPFVWLNPRRAWPHWTPEEGFGGIDFRRQTFPSDTRSAEITPSPYREESEPNVPLDLAIWSINDRDRMFDDLYGYPRTGHAYRFWWSYQYNFSLGDRAFERLADPPIIVYYPTESLLEDDPGNEPDNQGIAIGIGEQARSGATIAMPSALLDAGDIRSSAHRAWDIDQMKVSENFDAFIKKYEYLDVLKLRSLWAPEQGLTEGSGGSSSRNVATVFSELFMESQVVKLAEIVDIFNRYIIPPLVQMNWGPDARATLETHGFQRHDVETMQAIIQAMAQKLPEQLPVNFRESLEQLGVPVLTPKEFDVQAKTIADAAAKQQPPPTPAAQIKKNQAQVAASGHYQDGQESIELADSWLPATKNYEDEVIQSAAKQLRKLWAQAYADMYESFAVHLNHEDEINLNLEKRIFDARNLADTLLAGWRFSKEKTQRLIDETKKILTLALERTWARELRTHDLKAEFDVENADIANWLEEHGLSNVRDIGDTVRDELRTFLADALREEQSPGVIAARLREHFSEWPDWKAKRLARTEIGKATNIASLLAFKAAGVSIVEAIDGVEHDDECRQRNGRQFSIESAMAEAEDTHANCILHFHPVQLSEKKKRRFFS